MSKLHRPFRYKRVRKNTDGLGEPIVDNSECQDHCEGKPNRKISYNCLNADQDSHNSNTESPRYQRESLSSEAADCNENSRVETTGEAEELSQMKQTQPQTRRRSSAFQRLITWVKPVNRRDAICEQMERDIETSGVSLRQYRKFLATTYILYDLKML